MHMKRVLVVCLGNICRSPIGEGLLRHHAMVQGVRLQVASAGTSGAHQGEAPDPRSIDVMRRNGLDISGQRSAKLGPKDFERFDVVLAMDQANVRDAQAIAARAGARGKSVAEVLAFDPAQDVPDPYYGGPAGFDAVFAQVDAAAKAWVNRWKQNPD
jgi:protein-tyrosine phosphatase